MTKWHSWFDTAPLSGTDWELDFIANSRYNCPRLTLKVLLVRLVSILMQIISPVVVVFVVVVDVVVVVDDDDDDDDDDDVMKCT